jgi:hypothetical protein
MHALHHKEFIARATALGLVEACDVWKRVFWDREQDCNGSSVHATRAEARGECDDGDRLRRAMGLRTLPALTAYWSQRHPAAELDLCEVEDAAITAVLDLHHPEFDGIWWNDDFSPETLSAPRVGLFQRTLSLVVKTNGGGN